MKKMILRREIKKKNDEREIRIFCRNCKIEIFRYIKYKDTAFYDIEDLRIVGVDLEEDKKILEVECFKCKNIYRIQVEP